MTATKRTYKILSPITRQDGTTFWMRVGTGWENKDDSINFNLDAMPVVWKFQLRPLDDEDLRRREAYRAAHPATRAPAPAGASEPLPF